MTTGTEKEKGIFFNRELSWLEFNRRVLSEAFDKTVPLLERLKFLAITSSNLEEFFMVRVGSLIFLHQEGIESTSESALSVSEQLKAISKQTHAFLKDQDVCYKELESALASVGLRRLHMSDLTPSQLDYLCTLFQEEIFPLITPMNIDENKAFPLLTNLKRYLTVRLKSEDDNQRPVFSVLPLEPLLQRFYSLPTGGVFDFILLEDLLIYFLDLYFPNHTIEEISTFRITRNADISLRDDMASDLLQDMENILTGRQISDCVRLEISHGASDALLSVLTLGLGIDPQFIFHSRGPLDYKSFMSLATLPGNEKLKYKNWPPQPTPEISPSENIFEAISRQDLLLNHPYDSFEPILRLLEEAADDPEVLAIKQVLYRTASDSRIISALIRAAEKGKNVTVLVELKARFDEARNIERARALEIAGGQVIYGLRGYKTHSKICMVLRKEAQGIQRYMHFGTGNYNESTAKLYGDISLLTCDKDLGIDAANFFNTVSGFSRQQTFRKLSMAPVNMKERILQLIEVETELKRQGHPSHIMAKLNSISEPEVVKALYKAAQNGVRIDLNVRGICTIRPNLPDFSENIYVVSIIDRYLEHSRIFYFHHGGDPEIFISSADWMPRNLNRRIELMIPIKNSEHRKRLIKILETYFQDNQKAWVLQPDGSYRRLEPGNNEPLQSQRELYKMAKTRVKQIRNAQEILLEPMRAQE